MLEFDTTSHTYVLGGEKLPSVSEVIRYLAREVYEGVDQSVMDRAAERGTAVHIATQQLDESGACEIDNRYVGYVEAYAQFRRDHDVTWTAIERPLADPTAGYAGTIDRAGIVDGALCVLDIKTSGAIKKTLVKAQLNGYRNLYEVNGLGRPERLLCLQLREDGKYRLYDVALDMSEFEACLLLHKATRRRHRRLKID